MNDMSLHPFTEQELTGVPAPFAIDDAHILRSKIIGKCATVECWLVDRVQPFETPAPTFSSKVKQFEEILEKHKDVFNKPKKIQSYLKEFQRFAIFRSELAHAQLTLIETTDARILLKIQNATWGSNELRAKSIVLPHTELQAFWNEMCIAAQKITNYTITPPSLLTQRKPGPKPNSA